MAAINGPFQQRINFALTSAAIAVTSEAADTAGHAMRTAYAAKVLAGQANLPQVALAVLTNVTIAGELQLAAEDFAIPDSDILFAINTLFSGLAGVVQ